MLEPPPPESVLRAAQALRYRDFITVNLLVNRAALFPDQWIYVHRDDVHVARIQNYKNWSAAMVPDPTKTTLGMEYFCSEGDALWSLADEELVRLAERELQKLGLASAGEIVEGFVFRHKEAYPIYETDYREKIALIREYLSGLENLQTMGRNGCHRYNNQDHSMLCARYAVENLFGASHDIWQVNTESVNHEA